MPDRILVGRFGAPHGVRGEVRLQSYTGDPRAIGAYGPLQAADGRRFVLKSVRPVKDDMLVARVEGVESRDAAAALRHVELYLDRAALPPPEEDEFYIADLIGLAALDGAGAPLGTIVGVADHGAGPIMEIAGPEGRELLPFTRAVVPHVDLAAGHVIVHPPTEADAGAA